MEVNADIIGIGINPADFFQLPGHAKQQRIAQNANPGSAFKHRPNKTSGIG